MAKLSYSVVYVKKKCTSPPAVRVWTQWLEGVARKAKPQERQYLSWGSNRVPGMHGSRQRDRTDCSRRILIVNGRKSSSVSV